MINVRELITDPDFASSCTVIRTRGKWQRGRFTITEQKNIIYRGAVQPARVKELEQMPEGDRRRGVMKFFCRPPMVLHITNDSQPDGDDELISDEIMFNGARYRITQVADWSNNGYIRAFGVLTE
jgi:hypothetical protein